MTQAQILKDLIAKSGLSQKDFATKHGVDPTEVSRWCTGSRKIREDTLAALIFMEGYELKLTYELLKLC